jgi:hypothetical protein
MSEYNVSGKAKHVSTRANEWDDFERDANNTNNRNGTNNRNNTNNLITLIEPK